MREAHALVRNKPTFGRANPDELAATALVKRVALGDHDEEKCFAFELSMLEVDANGRFDTVCAYLDQEVVQRHHLLARHRLNLAIVRNAGQERATASVGKGVPSILPRPGVMIAPGSMVECAASCSAKPARPPRA